MCIHPSLNQWWLCFVGQLSGETLVEDPVHDFSFKWGSGIAWDCGRMCTITGVQSLLKDIGWDIQIRVLSDATAAIGIARRKGLGKIRHLDCTDLWIQDKIRSKAILLEKVLGLEHPADIFTTYVDRKTLDMALPKLGQMPTSGRPACAPAAMGL